MFECLDIERVKGFEWDEGNLYQNESKHGLKWQNIEEVFFNTPLIVVEDIKHSEDESRCVALGKSDDGTLITVIFTLRQDRIRVISARAMSRKERKFYEQAETDT